MWYNIALTQRYNWTQAMTKPHINAKSMRTLLTINNRMRHLSNRFGGSAHLQGTKHSAAWQDYGYPSQLDFWMYHTAYERIGLAAAVVDQPVEGCWISKPAISVGENDHERTGPEIEFDRMAERLNLWDTLKEVDRMQRVGHYAGLILRVADGMPPEQPLNRARPADLVQLIPAWEGQLRIGEIDNDRTSLRYGLPVNYVYQQKAIDATPGQVDGNQTFTVHHSRVLIWNEGAVGNTVYGKPALKPVFNSLLSWEKIAGAGGTGFHRQAALRMILESSDEASQDPDEGELEVLQEMVTSMMESMDTIPFIGGAKLNTLPTTLSNPEHFAEVVLKDIAAGCGRSAKALVGAQEGRLAGDSDARADAMADQSRREGYLTRQLRDMINRFVELGIMPRADWRIEWDSLLDSSDSQKLDLVAKMVDANQKSVFATGQPLFTPEEIRIMGGYTADLPDTIEPLFKDGE